MVAEGDSVTAGDAVAVGEPIEGESETLTSLL